MGRDKRLTGTLRGQTDRVIALAGFELSNPWKVLISHLANPIGVQRDKSDINQVEKRIM